MSPIDGQKELQFGYVYDRMDEEEIRERVRESVFNEWNSDKEIIKNLWETLQSDTEFKRSSIHSAIQTRKEEIA